MWIRFIKWCLCNKAGMTNHLIWWIVSEHFFLHLQSQIKQTGGETINFACLMWMTEWCSHGSFIFSFSPLITVISRNTRLWYNTVTTKMKGKKMLQYNFRHPEEVLTTAPACANNSVLVFLVFCCSFVSRPRVKASPGGGKMLVLPFPPFSLPFSFFLICVHTLPLFGLWLFCTPKFLLLLCMLSLNEWHERNPGF